MSWTAKVYHATSGEFLAVLTTRAQTMREAESNVVSKLALLLRANPADLDVRRLHQSAEGRRPA